MDVRSKFFTVGSFISPEATGKAAVSQDMVTAVAQATDAACFIDGDMTRCAALSYQLGKLRTQAAHTTGVIPLPASGNLAVQPTYANSLAASAQINANVHSTVLAALATLGATPSLAAVAPSGATLATQPFTPTIQ